ncbi:MAG: hypothetical protein FJW32_00135 [Acidobacteria bacterium]|nr:hypothetical protein [Acidobacteriota bacterium]
MKHLLLTLALALPAFAQQDRWARLAQLEPSHQTMVQSMDRHKHWGRFVSADDNTITIEKGANDLTFSKANVMTVAIRDRHPARRAAHGALIGGFPLMLAPQVGLLRFTAYGAGVGLFNHKSTVIYRGRRP